MSRVLAAAALLLVTGTEISVGSPSIAATRSPTRIVSLSLATDEILLDLVPQERIAAISQMATDPLYSCAVDAAVRLGQFVTNNTEQILARRPDLVFVTSYSTLETVQRLRKAGAPVLRLGNYESLQAVEDNLRMVGAAVAEEAGAERLIETMHSRIARVQALLPRDRPAPRVLSYSEGTVWAAHTTFDDVMGLVGAVNIPASLGLVGWPRVGVEQILAWQPEVLILGAAPGEEDAARARLLAIPGIAETPAARSGRIAVIPNNLFTTVSHHIAGFVERAAWELYQVGDPPR